MCSGNDIMVTGTAVYSGMEMVTACAERESNTFLPLGPKCYV